ncbi:unnamed protein product [Porites evermanni]|uniref:EGF-like domain-containing protein n=1 Tax=Porites evermanni TaxID=104178 RepID=A0ABN8S4J5_9CNID|nr:unnamed protein product [Porites evermanni]
MVRKKTISVYYITQSCLKGLGELFAANKYSLLSSSGLRISLTFLEVFLWIIKNFSYLTSFWIMSLLASSRWTVCSKGRRNYSKCHSIYSKHFLSLFSTFENAWTTLFVLLTLFDSGNSSSVISTGTIINTPLISQSGSLIPSSLSTDTNSHIIGNFSVITQNIFPQESNNTIGLRSVASVGSTEFSTTEERPTMTSSESVWESTTMETISLKTFNSSPSKTLISHDQTINVPSHSSPTRLLATEVETRSKDSISMAPITSKIPTTERSPLSETSDVSVSKIGSTFMTSHTKASSVTTSTSNPPPGLLPITGLRNSVASLWTASTKTLLSTDYQSNSTTVSSSVRSTVSRLKELSPSLKYSSPYSPTHLVSASTSGVSPILESLLPSFQTPVTSIPTEVPVVSSSESLVSSSLYSILISKSTHELTLTPSVELLTLPSQSTFLPPSSLPPQSPSSSAPTLSQSSSLPTTTSPSSSSVRSNISPSSSTSRTHFNASSLSPWAATQQAVSSVSFLTLPMSTTTSTQESSSTPSVDLLTSQSTLSPSSLPPQSPSLTPSSSRPKLSQSPSLPTTISTLTSTPLSYSLIPTSPLKTSRSSSASLSSPSLSLLLSPLPSSTVLPPVSSPSLLHLPLSSSSPLSSSLVVSLSRMSSPAVSPTTLPSISSPSSLHSQSVPQSASSSSPSSSSSMLIFLSSSPSSELSLLLASLSSSSAAALTSASSTSSIKRTSLPWPLHSASNPSSSLTPSPGPLSPPNVAPSTTLESSSSSLQPSLPLQSQPLPSSSLFSLPAPSIPFLTLSSPLKTAQPSFPSVSLPETTMTSINLSLTQISSSFISWSNYLLQKSSLVNNSTTYNVTSQKTSNVIAAVASSGIFGETPTSFMSSSIALVTSTTSPPDEPRILNLRFSLINETFHGDLNNASSAKFVTLSARVNFTLWELLNPFKIGLVDVRILQFSNGSVKVDSELVISSASNVTAQDVNQSLWTGNGSNSEGFIFGHIMVKETCTSGYCRNSGSCQEGTLGAKCSCSAGFVGRRCAQVAAFPVDGKYSDWSEFTDCTKTCGGGQKSRRRSCTNPSPQNGGKDCTSLGPDTEYADCNVDVSCPVSSEIWIAVGISCGAFLIILILLVLLCLRRRRKKAEENKRSMDLYNSNGHRNTPIPLEVIYEDKTIPKPSNKGHLNPEFIGEDDDDNDIYKAQLLLFLKQSHLIRPNVYPDEQDNNSDTSDYSRKNSRRVSALSAASDKNQGDNDKPVVELETAGQTQHDKKELPSTEL